MRKFMFIILLLLLVGCSDSKNSTLSYEEIQKIMLDTLQTEEGKKALQQLLADPKFQQQLVLNEKTVKGAIETTLTSEDSKEFWKSMFDDPKFQESYAKSLEQQHKKILEGMLTDADTQKELVTFFSQPDMQKQFETILKGKTLRKQMEEVAMETIENPLLQTKWQELIKKSGEAAGKEKEKEKEKEKSSGE